MCTLAVCFNTPLKRRSLQRHQYSGRYSGSGEIADPIYVTGSRYSDAAYHGRLLHRWFHQPLVLIPTEWGWLLTKTGGYEGEAMVGAVSNDRLFLVVVRLLLTSCVQAPAVWFHSVKMRRISIWLFGWLIVRCFSQTPLLIALALLASRNIPKE